MIALNGSSWIQPFVLGAVQTEVRVSRLQTKVISGYITNSKIKLMQGTVKGLDIFLTK